MKGVVWGYTFQEGVNKLLEIEEGYHRIGINTVKSKKSSITYEITLENGDFWRVARYAKSSRGIKANVSYIDGRIDADFVIQVIYPATQNPPFTAYKYYNIGEGG